MPHDDQGLFTLLAPLVCLPKPQFTATWLCVPSSPLFPLTCARPRARKRGNSGLQSGRRLTPGHCASSGVPSSLNMASSMLICTQIKRCERKVTSTCWGAGGSLASCHTASQEKDGKLLCSSIPSFHVPLPACLCLPGTEAALWPAQLGCSRSSRCQWVGSRCQPPAAARGRGTAASGPATRALDENQLSNQWGRKYMSAPSRAWYSSVWTCGGWQETTLTDLGGACRATVDEATAQKRCIMRLAALGLQDHDHSTGKRAACTMHRRKRTSAVWGRGAPGLVVRASPQSPTLTVLQGWWMLRVDTVGILWPPCTRHFANEAGHGKAGWAAHMHMVPLHPSTPNHVPPNPRPPCAPIHQNVVRLQIAVHSVASVGVSQRAQHLEHGAL